MKQRPSLAIVCRSFGQPGGAEVWARQQARALAATGRWDLHVICAEEGNLEGPWRVHRVPRPRVTGFWHKGEFAWQVGRVLKRERFDWIHTHDPLPGAHFVTTGPPQGFWAKEVRGKRFLGLNDWVTSWLEREMFSHPNFRLALPMSHRIAEELIRVYPGLVNRIAVLPPLPEGEGPGCDEVEAWRVKHRAARRIQPTERVILFVGNNFRLKGLHHLLDALGQERKAGRVWRLEVVGRGDKAEFTRMAGTFGVDSWVHFAGLEEGSMLPWYAAADLVALPSAFETFGMVVPEAMQVGRPVVVTRTVGAADLVRHGVTGWVIDGGGDLGRVLAEAASADLAGMGKAARASLGHGLSPESVAAPFLAVAFPERG